MRRNGKLLNSSIIKLLIPSILSSVAMQLGNVVDQMLIGSLLGETALASIQLLMPVILVSQLPGTVLGIGAVIAIGTLLGQRNLDQANKTITTVVVLNAVLSCVVIGLVLLFKVPLLNSLTGGRADFYQNANDYLMWFLPSVLMVNIAYPIVLLFTIDNHASLASTYMILSNVINLIFDYVLIRFTTLGTSAASISSLIGYVSCFWVFIVYKKSHTRQLKPDFRLGTFKEILARIVSVVKMGYTTLATNLSNVVFNLGMNTIIIYTVGGESVIAYTMCSNIILLTCLFTGGIGQMIPNFIGVLIGENDYFGIEYFMKQALKICTAFLVIWLIVVMAFPTIFLGLYGITGEASRAMSVMAIRIFAISLPFYIWNDFMSSYYQATGKSELSITSVILENIVAVLPLALIFGRLFGLAGIIGAIVVSQALASTIVVLYRKKKYSDLKGYLLLPEKKEFPNMETSTENDVENLMKISDAIVFFGNLHALTERQSYYMGLAVEEMAMNTIQFEGNKNRKLTIDISLTILPDEILIRLRDNGAIFNPWDNQASIEENSGEPITDSTGLIHRIASGTSYMRVLNMNNTIVTFSRKADHIA